MLERSACQYYSEGFNCAEAMLLAMNDAYELRLPPGSVRLVSGFGGGMGKEAACGAMTGVIAGLGALLVNTRGKNTAGFSAVCAAWVDTFEQEFQSSLCSVIKPCLKTAQSGCVETVRRTAQCLERFMQEKPLQTEK